jgi:hypothetical protein
MGIYSDYGRFMKARVFRDWCNSNTGIWFAFSTGSPRWDTLIEDSTSGQTVSRPFVPPSSPAPYTPLYRWFASYKGADLVDQEFALLDRSFGTSEPNGTAPFWPDNNFLDQNADLYPTTDYTPAYNMYGEGVIGATNNTLTSEWNPSGTQSPLYPSPTIPTFATSYRADWESYCNNYNYSSDPFNPDAPEPTDESQFDSYAHNYHIYNGINKNGSDELIRSLPLGLLSFIRGQAMFVEPIDEPDSPDSSENLRIFKYGAHYWKIITDANINRDKLPHFVLLTVNVFPNELAQSSLVEQQLPVRQVSVFKFPDYLASEWGLNQSSPRSKLVIRRENINIVTTPSIGNLFQSLSTPSTLKNIPFNCESPLDPNQSTNGSIELLINDYMTARHRVVQQTDRYGYIIGF